MRVRLRNDKLAELLTRRQISLNHWAKKIGVSRGHLSDLVNGKRLYPRPATRQKLLDSLDAEFEELFELDRQAATKRRPRKNTRPARLPTVHHPQHAHHPQHVASNRGDRPMFLLRQDLRFAFRQLVKRPGFTLAALLILALGIGSNTALFSIVHTLLWKPFPFGDPENLVNLFSTYDEHDVFHGNFSYPEFVDYREQTASVLELAVYDWEPFAVSGDDRPTRLGGAQVSHELFDVLRVDLLAGRFFTPEEDRPGGDPVVVLSEGLWRGQFGGDPDLVGREILLNSRSTTVIGIAPAGIDFPGDAHFWVPIARDAERDSRDSRWLRVIGRVKDGVDVHRAAGVLQAVGERLALDHPESNEGRSARLEALRERHLRGGVREVSYALLGVVSFLMLIVCANVAHLLLARGLARGRELAIRTALGAGRGQLVRQLMAESLLLALGGAAVGLALGHAALRQVEAALPPELPDWVAFSINGPVVAYTLAVTLAAALLCGLAPAVHSLRPDVRRALNSTVQASLGTRRLRGGFVVGEVALSLALLSGAGLMIQNVLNLVAVDPGFETDGGLTFGLDLLAMRGGESGPRHDRVEQYLERFAALPGVEHAALVDRFPLKPASDRKGFVIEGRQPEETSNDYALFERVSADYFAAMGIPILAGPTFEAQRRDGVHRVIVSQSLAERHWPGESPIGQRVQLGRDQTWYEIQAIVGDVRHHGLDQDAPPTMYVPYWEGPAVRMTWVLKTSGEPTDLVDPLRAAVAAVDPHQPIHEVATLEAVVAHSLWQWRLFTVLFWIFAAIALVLAAVGIYGVMSYTVSQRTREVGIRMALGAPYRRVLRLVLRQGLGLVAIGLAIGVPLALGLGTALSGVLAGVGRFEPAPLAAVAVLLTVVAWVAVLIPAHRAASSDPLRAIRYE